VSSQLLALTLHPSSFILWPRVGADWGELITIGYGQTTWNEQTLCGGGGDVDEPDGAIAGVDAADVVTAGLGECSLAEWLLDAGQRTGC
jgi:hypothetical protein